MRTPRSIGLRPRIGRIPALCLLVLLAPACSRGGAGSVSGEPDAARAQREVRYLMTALNPLRADALPVEKSSWYAQRKQTLERLRTSSRAIGLEALRVYREEPPPLPEVRAGLLDIAAHTAPEETRPLLVELVTRFGEHDLVRTEATQYLGETAPETALDVLTPLLSGHPDGRTYPPEERLLSAWIEACRKTGVDPVAMLATLATDLQRPQEVRHLATRSLGEFDSEQGRQALRALMVESGGNGYLRRLATQSLKKVLPPEEFCQLVRSVLEREADQDFLIFLEDARQKNCR